MGQFDQGAFAHSLLAGLNLGGDQYAQTAHLAQQAEEMRMRQAELARQHGQEAAAQQAMASAYDQAFPAPPPTLETPPSAPIAGPQVQQNQGVLDQARGAVLGSMGGLTQPPMADANPGMQAGMAGLQSLAAPDQKIQQQAAFPNPEYQQHMDRRAAFAGAPSHIQAEFMFGQRGYLEQSKQDQDWQRVEESMRQSGHADDIPHAKAVWYAIHAGVPATAAVGLTGGGGSEQAFAILNDPNSDPAARAHAQAMLQQSGGLARGMGATMPARPKAPVPGIDAAALKAKWNDLVQSIGGEGVFDPRLLPVVRQKFLAGQKVGDTLWTKALPVDQAGKAKTKALKAEYDFQKAKWQAAHSDYNAVLKTFPAEGDPALKTAADAKQAAETDWSDAHKAYKSHLSGQGVDSDLLDAVDHDMPEASPEDKAAEYKRRKGIK